MSDPIGALEAQGMNKHGRLKSKTKAALMRTLHAFAKTKGMRIKDDRLYKKLEIFDMAAVEDTQWACFDYEPLEGVNNPNELEIFHAIFSVIASLPVRRR